MYYTFILNPFVLCVVVWSISLFGNLFGFIPYPEKTSQFYLIIASSFLSLLFGWMIAKSRSITIRKNREKRVELIDFLRKNISLIKNMYLIYILVACIGIALVYLKLFSQVSFSYYLTHPVTVKSEEVGRSVIGAHLMSFGYIASYLSIIIYKISHEKRYVIISAIIIFLYSASFYGRFPIFIALLASFFFLTSMNYALLIKRKLSRLVLFTIISFVLAFSFLSHTMENRISEYGERYDPYSGIISSGIEGFFDDFDVVFASSRAASLTYAYLFNAPATLNYWAEHSAQLEYGKNTVPYFYRLAEKLGAITEYDYDKGVHEIVKVQGVRLQLPTYLGAIYKDFGHYGVWFIPGLIMFYGVLLYYRIIKRCDISSMFVLPIVNTFFVLSILDFIFSGVMQLDILLVGIGTGEYLKYKITEHSKV